jgi:4-phytase/acid phosphatase
MILPTGKASPAQPDKTGRTKPNSQLKMVVILSRHGVRSPTWTQARLNAYSVQPWPSWNVPPANLTARGHQLVRQFGGFDRLALTSAGLLPGLDCAGVASTYIWADTDQRTIESGQALAEGLFPGCHVPLHGLPEGENDPLFHPTVNRVTATEADAAYAELSARTARPAPASQTKLIAELNDILLGCSPNAACSPTHAPRMKLSDAPTATLRGKGDHLADIEGPLPFASSFAEDLLLEYADGMPMSQVGWGRVDAARIGRLLALHSGYFELMHRTPAIARAEASNLLFHIVRTLQQGVQQEPVDGAIGPAGSKAVVLVGHDTNLAAIASLLGVHWHLDGRDDDTPPGTQLAFELWQDEAGMYTVRVNVAMQTLHQLRAMTALTLAAPPARQRLSLPNCRACGWDEFRKLTDAVIDNHDVLPTNIP